MAVASLHFTGMAAMTVIPLAPLTDASVADSANVVLAFAVSAVGLMMLGTGIAMVIHFYRQVRDTEQIEELRYKELLKTSTDGIHNRSQPPSASSRASAASRRG